MLNPNAIALPYLVFQAAHTPNRFCRYDNADTDKTDFCCQASMCPARLCNRGIAALNFRFSLSKIPFVVNLTFRVVDYLRILCYDKNIQRRFLKWCRETKNALIFLNIKAFLKKKNI